MQVWWILINSFLYYAEIDFFLRFTGSKRRQYIIPYIIFNDIMTVIAIWTQMFNYVVLIQMVLIFIYMSMCLRVSPRNTLTPVIIIFTLVTFMEGFVTVFMRFLSLTLTSQLLGMGVQFILPAVFALLVYLALRFIAHKYHLMNKDGIFSYLYILLFPCSMMIWWIRTSLGLDRNHGQFSHGAIISGEVPSVLYASLCMVGVVIIFFIIIQVFYKITVLSQKDMERALLESQVKEQCNYIEEARKRNEHYRSFQHDISNHLLVLSGLLNKKNFGEAKHYLKELNVAANSLAENISTGNTVLDVLLCEKIRYAKQYNISVICDVKIPSESRIDNIDLCIIFSNGLDNAIKACMVAAPEYKYIKIIGKPKNSFLLIEMINGVEDTDQSISIGTGLKNIGLTVEKYDGVVNILDHMMGNRNEFCLSILLCYGI